MKTKIFLAYLIIFLPLTLSAQDTKKQIAKKGDAAWEQLLSSLKGKDMLIDPPVSVNTIFNDFGTYKSKSMLFPEFSFENCVFDSKGNKYYYSGEAEGLKFFVIKYDDNITELLRKYSNAIGPVGDKNWQLLGTVKETYAWWGTIVLMDIQAVRVAQKATIILENGKLNFVAGELIDKLMKEKAKSGLGKVPKNLTKIPSGLDAMTVAKLYFQLGNIEKNEELWLKLLASTNFYMGKTERRVDYWWKNLNKEGRTFYYVRTAEDKETRKKYFWQIQDNGVDVGSPKPMTLILEEGEWKIGSGI